MLSTNHHAYLLIDTWDKEALTQELLGRLDLPAQNNPDLIIHEGALGIDEARAITARIITRPVLEKRVIIIDASSATIQAQNALLKTLEEPGEGNIFFLVVPYEDVLLPTLRSRIQKLPNTYVRSGISTSKDSPEHFLKLSVQKRFDFAKKFKENEKKLGPFLDALLRCVNQEGVSHSLSKKIFVLRRYADDTSADSRLVLEHLALVI